MNMEYRPNDEQQWKAKVSDDKTCTSLPLPTTISLWSALEKSRSNHQSYGWLECRTIYFSPVTIRKIQNQ
jgi:hypothetical protein